jgi:hypothetical protein
MISPVPAIVWRMRLADQCAVEAVEARDLVGRGEIGIVGDVVDRAGIGVEIRDLGAQRLWQQERADREVLVPGALARRRLSGGGGGGQGLVPDLQRARRHNGRQIESRRPGLKRIKSEQYAEVTLAPRSAGVAVARIGRDGAWYDQCYTPSAWPEMEKVGESRRK